jgi:hypothetical protein
VEFTTKPRRARPKPKRAQAKKEAGTSDPGMIGYSLPEIRRLLNT